MVTLETLLSFVLGLAIIAITLQDAFEVMLLPRRLKRRWRLMSVFFESFWNLWRLRAYRGRGAISQGTREGFLSLFGPIAMVMLFALWTLLLVTGFALVQWSLERHLPEHYTLGGYLYLSGVTLVTLGYGDFAPHIGITRAISVIESVTGFGMLAAVIGYLPVLYQLFSKREAHVIQLDVRAGSPPTAVTLLSRHACDDAVDKLDDLLRDWERWCAELIESHLSYPMLSFYRSQHANQNWLSALASITDCCAIMLVGLKGVPAFQAKMTFAISRLALVELCRVFRLKPMTGFSSRLSQRDFIGLQGELQEAGLQWLNPKEAETTLESFRKTYEPYLCALAHHLIIEIPPMMHKAGDDHDLDNWQRSPGGKSAKDLVDHAPMQKPPG